jgi:hypothetical protein
MTEAGGYVATTTHHKNTLYYGDNLPIRREGIQAYRNKKLKAK